MSEAGQGSLPPSEGAERATAEEISHARQQAEWVGRIGDTDIEVDEGALVSRGEDAAHGDQVIWVQCWMRLDPDFELEVD